MKSMLGLVNRSLKWKLVLVTIAVVLFNALTIGFFTYNRASGTIRSEVEHYSGQVLKQANLNLNRYFLEYEKNFVLMGASSELWKWLKLPQGISSDLVQVYRTIESNYLLPFLFQHQEVLSLTIYNVNGNEMHYSLIGFKGDYSVTSEPWFSDPRIADQKRTVIYPNRTDHYLFKEPNQKSVPIITVIKRVESSGAAGYLVADISLEPALTILKQMNISDKTVGMISEPSGKVIAHPNAECIFRYLDNDIVEHINESTSGSFYREQHNEMVVFDTLPYTGWKTISVVPYSEVAKGILKVRNVTAYIVSASLLVTVIIIILVAASITKRIRLLRLTMKWMNPEHLGSRAEVKGTDEVADLAITYNNMLDHLQASLQALARSRGLQQEALMNALQSQINSHFLYNTLESINSMANLANHKEIELTTVSLSNMLRYTANYLDSTVTLQEEIQHCMNYLQIMQIRYMDDSVSFKLDVEEDCQNARCLKAIIQPVIENSIKHGIESTGDPVRIRITVSRLDEQYVQVDITDNGTGFDPERLTELTALLNASSEDMDQQYTSMSRIGILNVHYRIRMYYRDDRSGMSLGNLPDGRGAWVRLIFPLQFMGKGE